MGEWRQGVEGRRRGALVLNKRQHLVRRVRYPESVCVESVDDAAFVEVLFRVGSWVQQLQGGMAVRSGGELC